MRLRQLVCFLRVCELGSISRAAAELNIAQPALGLQIRGLEQEFRAELVVRSSRGVTPTRAGELVMEHCRSILRQDREIRGRINQLNRDEPTRLTLSLTASLIHLIAGPVLEEMQRLHPDVQLELMEAASELTVQWVEEKRADLGLGFGTFPSQSIDGKAILKERLFYLSSPQASPATIPFAEVLSLPLALPNEQNSIRTVIEDGAKMLDMPVVGTCEISSLDASRLIARRGIAGTIVPYGGIADDVARGELSARMIVEPMLERPLFVWRRIDHPPSRIERELTAIVIAALRRASRNRVPDGTYIFLDGDDADEATIEAERGALPPGTVIGLVA